MKACRGGSRRERPRPASEQPSVRRSRNSSTASSRRAATAVIVHARKAVLGAWSPRDNREIPPLRYDVVRELKARIAPVPVVLNGGLRTAEQVVSRAGVGGWRDAGPRGLSPADAAGGTVAAVAHRAHRASQLLERMARTRAAKWRAANG